MLVNYSVFTGPAIILAIVVVCLATVSIIAVMRSQKRRLAAGRESMIGQVATTYSPLNPEGTVQAVGELWHARARGPHVSPGQQVTILGMDGLTLIVKQKEVTGD
jgi:membrane-bound ClpP family serine protease